MLGNLGELACLLMRMNADGRKLLVNVAKDILSHQKYTADAVPEVDELDRVLDMIA